MRGFAFCVASLGAGPGVTCYCFRGLEVLGGGVTCYGFCEYDACSDTLFLSTNTLIQESGYKDSLTAARHALQACHGFATHATAKLFCQPRTSILCDACSACFGEMGFATPNWTACIDFNMADFATLPQLE